MKQLYYGISKQKMIFELTFI